MFSLFPKVGCDYGLVMGTVGLSHVMNAYLTYLVVKARKKYDVQYPALYAEKGQDGAEEFNCAQRAHQATLESLSMTQILILANGVAFPKLSSLFGLFYVLGRVLYGRGYSKNGPKGRMLGGLISHLGDLPLLILTFVNAFMMIRGIPGGVCPHAGKTH